jgi:hypothetical protein
LAMHFAQNRILMGQSANAQCAFDNCPGQVDAHVRKEACLVVYDVSRERGGRNLIFNFYYCEATATNYRGISFWLLSRRTSSLSVFAVEMQPPVATGRVYQEYATTSGKEEELLPQKS